MTDQPTFTKILATGATAILLSSNISSFSLADDKGAKSPVITVDHLMAMQGPRDVQISPDNKWIAYAVSRDDEEKDRGFRQIWMTSVDGKTTIPLTASYANASSPRWNPDGTTLAFIGRRGPDTDAKSQVWLLNRNGGEAQQYTHVKQGVSSFVWSPDGKRILLSIHDAKPENKDKKTGKDKAEPYVIDRLQFKADYRGYLDRRRTHFYLYNGEGDPVQITSGDYDDSSPAWSPDGNRVAFTSSRDGDPDSNRNSDIWTVSTDRNAKAFPLTQVTTSKGSDRSPSWSPDGKALAYISKNYPDKLGYATNHVTIKNADGSGNPRILTADYDRSSSGPEFSGDGKSIYFTADDKGNRPLMLVNVRSGKLQAVTKGDHSIGGYDIGSNGLIAVVKSSYHDTANVHVMKKGKSSRITKLNDDLLAGVALGRVERLTVAGFNGDPVESFVVYPPDYQAGKAYPTIFYLHGGPVGQHSAGFNGSAQLYAANGYITVMPNVHGSTGYGEDFSYALRAQWGQPDSIDVDAIADHLVNAGVSDGDKLGVGGWSYGGMLTNYLITKYTRFAGAVTGASSLNYRANYGHDQYQRIWVDELGLPWENVEAWESISPFNDVGKITTPTLVMGGQNDWNVPIISSEQLYQVLKKRGIDTQLVVYPNEFHGISRPSFKRDRYNRYLGWFKKYVYGE